MNLFFTQIIFLIVFQVRLQQTACQHKQRRTYNFTFVRFIHVIIFFLLDANVRNYVKYIGFP